MTDHCTRRKVLGAATTGVAGLAGCLGGDDKSAVRETPDPVGLDGTKVCDACGMVIAEGYGPNGQVAYEGDHPPDRDGPAWFDSVRELYVDRFGQEARGIEPIVTYVTDYATFEYAIEERKDDRYITGSVAPGTFVRAEEAVFVIDSGLRGAMGAELLPFGREAAAKSFVEAEGGQVVAAEDVTRDLVQSL